MRCKNSNKSERDKKVSGRTASKFFRELCNAKWSEAFVSAVEGLTGTNSFTYVTAITRLVKSEKAVWENHAPFRAAMRQNPIRIITLEEMLRKVYGKLSTTLAGTEFGRTLQLFRAAGFRI